MPRDRCSIAEAAHEPPVQKIALTAVVDQADNSTYSCADPGPSRRAANSVMRKNRRTKHSRQRTYIRLRARVDRLEDAISHFYNVINELHERVSTLEKKPKPLAKDE